MTNEERAERFWKLVSIRGPNECWAWRGGCNENGNGYVRWEGHKRAVHVVAYHLSKGEPIADGRRSIIDACPRLHSCCNPAHLNPYKGVHHA